MTEDEFLRVRARLWEQVGMNKEPNKQTMTNLFSRINGEWRNYGSAPANQGAMEMKQDADGVYATRMSGYSIMGSAFLPCDRCGEVWSNVNMQGGLCEYCGVIVIKQKEDSLSRCHPSMTRTP